MKQLWLLSNDYFFSSQLKGDVQRLGLALQQIATADGLLEQLGDNSEDSLVLIDLTLGSLDLEVISKLKTLSPPPVAIIAYGPHVAAGKLSAAREAGCDQVLTRGQAHSEIANVLGQFL